MSKIYFAKPSIGKWELEYAMCTVRRGWGEHCTKPDIAIMAPWNLSDEVVLHHRYVRDWGGELSVAIPYARMVA